MGKSLVEDSLVGYIIFISIYIYIFMIIYAYICIYVYIYIHMYTQDYTILYNIYKVIHDMDILLQLRRISDYQKAKIEWLNDYTCSYFLLVTTIHVTLWQRHLQRSTCVGQGWTRRFVWHTKRPWSTGPWEDDIASRQSTRQRRKRRRWWENGNT